jgi:hypothetical protein
MSPAAISAFLWQVEGVSVSVALSQSVLVELRAGLDRAPAGTEFGGILLGSVASDGDGFRTQVDAFELFPIEHRHGANYALSPREQRLLERRLSRLRRKGRVPVGICRSHQRRGLYLDRRDFDLFQTDFRHPSSIFLLVRRDHGEVATGAVFVWEEGDIRRHASYREFPLPGLPAAQELSLAKTPRTQRRPGTQEILSWRSCFWRLGERPVFSDLLAGVARQAAPPALAAKVLLTIALPLFSFYAAREIALHRAGRSEFNQVRPANEPAPLPPPRNDPDAAPDAGPKPNPFPAASSVLTPAEPAVSRTPIRPKTILASDSRGRFAVDPESASSSDRDRPRTDGASARGIPVLPEPPPLQPARPAATFPRIVASPSAVQGRSPGQVIAYLKPEPPSSIRLAIKKVFSGHGTGDGFVPASPVELPLPSPPPEALPLEEGTNVEMVAKVDREGNVVNVKVVEGNRQLAGRSADALLRWRFDPARRKGAPVESAMRIRFEFRNPSK